MDLLGGLGLVQEYLWYVALVLIVGMGIVCTLMLRGIQFRNFREMCRCTFGKGSSQEGGMSSFQAFCLSMGSRIGTGNITGTILAVMTGGPGAVFWMWIFALLGMATSFVESTIGQIYKSRDEEGNCHGGMAYSLIKALGSRRAGVTVAGIMILIYVVGFNSMQVASIGTSIGAVFGADFKAVFSVIFAIVVFVLLLGGAKRVANISSKVVPVMALMWFVVCIATIVLQADGILNAFSSIFTYAFFSPECVVGGGIGTIVMLGMKRGVLSNEAGIGTIPNLSSMSNVKHPVSQGMTQALGVFIDLLVSTMTALVILSYADYEVLYGMGLEAMPLFQAVLEGTIGGAGPYIVTLFIFLFAFTSLISNYLIGENNLGIIAKDRRARYVLVVIGTLVVFISSFYASDALWVVVDLLLAICAFANTYSLIKLGGRAKEAFRDYMDQKAAGVRDPVFRMSALSDPTGVTEWDD